MQETEVLHGESKQKREFCVESHTEANLAVVIFELF
jgi:hypothetical protein